MVKGLIGSLYSFGLVVGFELRRLSSVVVFGSSSVTWISLSRSYIHILNSYIVESQQITIETGLLLWFIVV